MNPLWLSHFTATSSIGRGLDQTLSALREHRPGLAPCTFDTVNLATFIGEVAGVDAVRLPAHLAVSRVKFLRELHRYGVPVIDLAEAELAADLANA